MRASILFVVIVGLFACGQALDFKEKLKEVGKTLVNTVVSKGKELLASGLKTLLDKFGKRDLGQIKDFLFGLVKKAGHFIEEGKDKAAGAFSGALDKLKGIFDKFHSRLGLLKDADDVKDEIDDVVAEHHVLHKRILAELLQKGKDLFRAAVEKVKSIGSALKAKASAVASALIQKASDLLIGKRATLSDHLKKVGGFLSKAFSPFKDLVSGIGSSLKGHFSNLVDTVKGHVSALKTKLAGHAADLKTHGSKLLEHGKNAVGALSEVVKDILKQTVTNAKPALDGFSKTLASAGKTVLDHFTGADKKTV